MAPTALSKRFELKRLRLKADADGLTLLELIESEILATDGLRSGGIASTSSGTNSVSFFSPSLAGTLAPAEVADMLVSFHTTCEAAVTALGGSPTNAEVEAQMLEDDYFSGATRVIPSYTSLRCV